MVISNSTKGMKLYSEIPDPLANFMNVSSIVRSTAESDPGIIERAAPITPLSIKSTAPHLSRILQTTPDT